MIEKKRIRNYGFWTALIAQLLLVGQLGAKLFFDYTIADETSVSVSLFANSILVVLSTLGIISNPTKPSSKGFNL